MKRMIHNALAAGLLSLLGANVCLAENWAGWRGPTGMGITEDKELPLKWGGKTGENVIWKSPLGGIGNSSPIVWGDKVFVTISRKQTNKEQDAKEVPEHWVACFQKSDGKELWRTAVAQGHYARGYGIYAVPTPVTDGERIYSWFSSGVFAALDFDGKVVWRDEVPDDSPKHIDGMVNSPILYNDTVIRISNVLQPDAKGTVQALDKKTGAVKWEKPLVKSGIANASPLLLKVGDVEELLIPSGNALDAINPADGSPIWTVKRRMGDLSPVFSGGVLFTDCPGGPGMAIDPVGKGDITKTNVKWKIDKTPDSYAFASPVISGDYIFRATGGKTSTLTCWKLSTGDVVYSEPVEKIDNLGSPIVAPNGLVYFLSSGKSYIIKPGDKLEVVAQNELGGFHGNNGPSPAIADNRIYMRDAEAAGPAGAFLYCVGKK